MSISVSPILRDDVSWTEWGDDYLLFNPTTRSTIRVNTEEQLWISNLNGSQSLEDLEATSSNPNRLLETLEKLCRGQFLINSDELFGFLFPNQQRQSWSPPKRQWLYGSLVSKTLRWPITLPSASIYIALSMMVFGLSLGLIWYHSTPLSLHPWTINGDWLLGSFSAYAGVSLTMSLAALIQASMLSAYTTHIDVHLRHTLGIFHIGVNRVPIYHTNVDTQRQFAGVGIATALLAIGVCWFAESQRLNGVGGSVSTALLLLLVWELCPFFDTNGAQLLETVTVHKQRLRTQDFLRSSLLSSRFGDIEGQLGLRITLSIWLLWFGAAIHLLGQYVLPHLSTLLVQTLQYPTLIGQIWLGYISLLISLGYVYFVFQGLRLSGNLLEQVLPRRPTVDTASTSEETYALCKSCFPELHPFENITDCQTLTISTGSRIDRLIAPSHIWIVLDGQVAFIAPKPEGGFTTLFEIPAPSALLCPSESDPSPTLWSRSEVTVVSLPYRPEQWHTLRDILSAIQTFEPFSMLSAEWQWMLAIQASQQTIPSEQYLIEQSAPSNTLYLLTHGEVSVETPTPISLTAPAILGEMGILSEAPRSASIRCSTWCTVVVIPAHIIRVCLQQHPEMRQWLDRLVDNRTSPVAIPNGGSNGPQ